VSENRLAGRSRGGRTVDFLVRPPQAVFRLIMESPDLDKGGEAPPPPEDDDGGGRRPEPEPWLVGMMAFMVGFAGVTAVRYAAALVKVMR
jgi:hypothetical protein